MSRKRYDRLDERHGLVVTEIDGDEIVTPLVYSVCQHCHGTGLLELDLAYDDFEDPGFLQDYTNGAFNVACGECDGRRVVPTMPNDPRIQAYAARLRRYDVEEQHELELGL